MKLKKLIAKAICCTLLITGIGYTNLHVNANESDETEYDILNDNLPDFEEDDEYKYSDGSYENVYDDNGNIIKVIQYNPDNSIESYFEYEYDAAFNQTKVAKYNGDGSAVFSIVSSGFDLYGNPSERIYYDAYGNISERYEYEYDTSGNMTKQTKYNGNGEKIEEQKYSYDENNNITDSTYDNYITDTKTNYENVSLTTSGLYCTQTSPSIIIGMVVKKEDEYVVEYRWRAYDLNKGIWIEISPWTKNNEWLNWTPDKAGDYMIVAYARYEGEENARVTASYNVSVSYIKGICQMPYYGEGGGYLIGFESYDNPNQQYKYEMLVLDCSLLAENKPAWIYTTGKYNVSDGNAFWTVWQPEYGYFWTLFRLYDENDNLIDEQCYGFVNAY